MMFLEMGINRNKITPQFISEKLIKLIWRRSRGPVGGILNIKISTEAGNGDACRGRGTAAMETHLSALQERTGCEECS